MLTGDAGIARVAKRVFGAAETTDVISLSYGSVPGEPEGRVAELFVNVEHACREGGRRGSRHGAWGPDAELALYLSHGCGHLAGGEDATAAGRRGMRRRDLRRVASAARSGLVDGLLPDEPARRVVRQGGGRAKPGGTAG